MVRLVRFAQTDRPGDPSSSALEQNGTPRPSRHHCSRTLIADKGSPDPLRHRAKLVTAIARGRHWLAEIEAGAATIDDIAAREACSKRHVNMTISLAFLAPSEPPSRVDCRTGSASPACSMRPPRGHASIRCWGAKTLPCVEAIVAAGIARVVSAIEDPHPEVAGSWHGIQIQLAKCVAELPHTAGKCAHWPAWANRHKVVAIR